MYIYVFIYFEHDAVIISSVNEVLHPKMFKAVTNV